MGEWYLCSHGMAYNTGGSTKVKVKEVLSMRSIQNIDDFLEWELCGELKQCRDLIKKDREAINAIDDILFNKENMQNQSNVSEDTTAK